MATLHGSEIHHGIEQRQAKERLVERAPAIKPCRASSSAPAAGSTLSAPLPSATATGTATTRASPGTKYCAAERLPAEELDAAVLDALLHTHERTDLFDKAVASARCRARSERASWSHLPSAND